MTIASDPSARWLSGYIPDLPTPFRDGCDVDWAALERLSARQRAAGSTAVVVTETAGESSTLTLAEHRAIISTVVAHLRGRVAVIAGASSNSTAHAVALAQQAEAVGADALIAVVPYYNKPMPSGVYQHFRAIADSTTLPIVVHDVPSRTVRGLTDETLVRLAASPQFIGVKDAAGDIGRPLRLRPLVRPEFRFLSGDDTTAAGYLAQGGDGCISLVANVVPALCRRFYLGARHGNWAATRNILCQIQSLSVILDDENAPATLKYVMSLLGLISPAVRLPLVELSASSKVAIDRAFEILDRDNSAVFAATMIWPVAARVP